MKKIENLLLKACGYTILTLSLFYLVAALGDFTKAAIDFPTFILIFVFGIIISAASMVLYVKAIKLPIRILLHYAILLASFFIIFVLAGKLSNGGSSTVFTAVIIFTVLYAVIFAITYLIRRAVIGADRALDAKPGKTKDEKKTYTPLYK